jgi:cytidylate kinase
LAKELAKKLGFLYIDTGAMYRAITWYAIQKGYLSSEFFDKEALIRDLDKIKVTFKKASDSDSAEVYLNGENIEDKIRSMEVSSLVSLVAAVPEVRKKLVSEQRKMAEDHSVVMDGRDIGSVVFPQADLKIFMTALPEIRAKRRFKELNESGQTVSFEEVLKNVNQRDKLDSERKDSPLIITPDAIKVDNSYMTREQQLDYILDVIHKKQQS